VNTTPEDEEETLDDYEAGFLDGYFHAKGIESPSEEQLLEGFRVLDAFVDAHPSEEEE
jgi:hypothetical protein